MQVICRYASLILTVLGMMVGLTGYYLDLVLPASLTRLLWLGATLFIAMTGFAAGCLVQRLNLRSHTDLVTGVWNRRYLYLRLQEEEARATRKKTPLCVALIDVDDFKSVNDAYGHAAGDLLLFDLAAIFKKDARGTDIVTRWGGDEFAIVFSETSLADALQIVERIRIKVEANFKSSYGITISAGIIRLEPGRGSNDLFSKVDQALYKAKTQRNSVIVAADL